MGLGIYIFLGLFVYDGGLMAILNRERRWTDLVWGEVDRFWVSGTDLGGSKGHVRKMGWETQVAWVTRVTVDFY